MSFLDTKHKKKSAVITAIIMLLLILLVFQFGLDYKDPPDEYGVEINFGYTKAGSGNNTTSTEEVKTDQVEQQEEQQEETPEEPIDEQPVEEVPQETAVEEVVTQDTEDAPTVNNTPTTEETTKPTETVKPVEAVKPTEEVTKPTETVKPVEPVKEPSPDKATTDAMNNILNGPTNDGTSTEGDGDSTTPGNKGDENGDPYALGNNGGGSGKGTGKGLSGRSIKSRKKFAQDCNFGGSVTVEITVNNKGTVTNVRVINADEPCLVEAAMKTARAYKFNADPTLPNEQKGKVKINFNLGE